MKMKLIQEIVFSYAKVQLFDNKLIRLEAFGDVQINLAMAREMNSTIGILSKGKPALVLLVGNALTKVDQEAMDLSSSEEGLQYTIGDAMVVKSIKERVLANFYLKFNRPKKPTKIFNSEEEAIKWLFSLEHKMVPA
jgi:hypothetical protein